MIELVISESLFAAVRDELLGGDTERCTVLLANEVSDKNGRIRLLVTEVVTPADEHYLRKGLLEAELSPAFVAQVTKQAKLADQALIFAHSHPGDEAPEFSEVDDDGETHLASFLARRHPKVHAALVVSRGGVRARVLGPGNELAVIGIGDRRTVHFRPARSVSTFQPQFDRQVRAFGKAGQQELSELAVGIVGLGGTGSVVATELVHLGIRKFVLIDPDTVEVTNLNRLPNAKHSDVGRSKVDVASDFIRAHCNEAEIRAIQDDVAFSDIAMELLTTDVIFGCTDSHGSRAVIQQISYQYLLPLIDMGVTIVAKDGAIAHIIGRVQLLSPGLGCLTCGQLLDPEQVRRDMLTETQRRADPYIPGSQEPAPAVISFNATVASLAVSMLLAVVLGIPNGGRQLIYDARKPSLRSVRTTPEQNCYVCSPQGSLAKGNTWPIFGRGRVSP